MPTDTQVNDLKINVLTEAQYEQIASPSSTELYLVPEVVDTTPTSGSTNPITSGGVYNALQNISTPKQRKGIIAIKAIPALTARVGDRYFFSKNIKIRTKELLNVDLSALNNEEYQNGQEPTRLLTFQKNNATEGYLYIISKDIFGVNKKLQNPCLVTIPQNFNAARFITDSQYRSGLVTKADKLCTKDMASPYFEINNGYVICTKRLPVACGKPSVNKIKQNDFLSLLGITNKQALSIARRYKKTYTKRIQGGRESFGSAMTDWRIGIYSKIHQGDFVRSIYKKHTFDFSARHRGKRSIHIVTLFHKWVGGICSRHKNWKVINMT